MSGLSLRGIHKSFGDVAVLHGVSVEAEAGEFLVLVGPSGCGKSTLLRCIAGLEEPDAGEIHIGGRRVDGLEPRERDVAMVFQSYALYPHMTVRQNMGFALRLKKTPEAEIGRLVGQAAEMLALGELLDRFPRELSGGQRERVAFGRAVVRRPSVFLFDEPLSNLDAALRNQLRVELKRLHQELGATMVYVTHDQVEAMTLADRIAVLEGGRLQQLAAPPAIYSDPANRFVAGFIGTPPMSFLSGVEPDCVLGVRPHEVQIGTGTLQATVDVVETLGFESFVHLRLGSERLIARIEGPPPPPGEVMVDIGSPLRFDPSTGARMQGGAT